MTLSPEYLEPRLMLTAGDFNASGVVDAADYVTARATAGDLAEWRANYGHAGDWPESAGTYREFSGQLFVDGPSYEDIRQGAAGDCVLMTDLAAVALADPSIIDEMFSVHGDGTYTVRFFHEGEAEYVTVDSYLPTNALGRTLYASPGEHFQDQDVELWVALAEKAFCQFNGEFDVWNEGLNSYSDALGGGDPITRLHNVSGWVMTEYLAFMSWEETEGLFLDAYGEGETITFATIADPPDEAIVPNHAYLLLDWSDGEATLYNPYGSTIVLTWTEMEANFLGFYSTDRI